MDEPTSVLTPQESEQLFVILNKLAATGCSVLFISHKLKEVKEITQRATILRRGRVVDTVTSSEVSTEQLAKMMVGSDPQHVKPKIGTKSNDILVQISGLCRPADTPFSTPLLDINLDVKAGEIVGIAGIAGNGQSELMEALTGEWRSRDSIKVLDVLGVDIRDYSPHKRRQMGIGFLPEERNGHSAVMGMTLTENTLLTNHNNPEVQKHSIIQNDNLEKLTSNIIHDYDVRTPLQNPLASSLSGGNLQKFVVGREIIKKPSVFFVAQPTWGVDIGATKFIRNALIDLANEGCGIIVISQDLEELFELADSISVLFRGKLSERKPVKELNSQKIGLLMGGEDGASLAKEHS
jgi:simple sugar transport system ATP-binding protein